MTWLVVGLGNPGPTYASTRHNVGYLVVDVLAGRVGASLKAHASKRADVLEGRLVDQRVVLGRSRSFMNESGGAVSTLAKYYDVEADHSGRRSEHGKDRAQGQQLLAGGHVAGLAGLHHGHSSAGEDSHVTQLSHESQGHWKGIRVTTNL